MLATHEDDAHSTKKAAKGNKSVKHARQGSNVQMDRDLDTFKGIVRDYNKTLKVDPRDFKAELPILQALGAGSYDNVSNLEYLQLQLEVALKKFVKDWKTIDTQKINQLMKYGIVQEIMKIEERKAVRKEAANRPSPSKREDSGEQKQHTPRLGSPGKKNQDLGHLSEQRRRLMAQQPKHFLDAPEDSRSTLFGRSRSRLAQQDSTVVDRGEKRAPTPIGSAMKGGHERPMTAAAGGTASISGFGGSEAPKKKQINFNDSGSVENERSSAPPKKTAKDAPTIGNALMMKMEF